MGTLKKALIGGGGLVAVGVCAGAYYLHNDVVPQRLTVALNQTFDDAYKQNKLSGEITITKSGPITVEADGFFGYKALMPAITVTKAAGKEDGFALNLVAPAAAYKLDVTDKLAAIATISGLSDKPLRAEMTSTAPVTFEQSITAGQSRSKLSGYFTGMCPVVKTSAELSEGNVYKLTTTASDCTFLGAFGDQSDFAANVSSKTGFTASIANDGKNNYTGSENVSLKDLVIKAHSTRDTGEEATLKAAELSFNVGYDKLPGGKDMETALKTFDLSVLPENVSFGINAKDLTLSMPPMLPASPTLSFHAGVNLNGLKAERGSLAVKAGYDVRNLESLGLMATSISAPTASSCDIDLGNLPMKEISSLVESVVMAGPDAEGMLQNRMVETLRKADATLALACHSSRGALYDADIVANHKADNGSFPGAGKFEVHGLENSLAAMRDIMGFDVGPLAEVFTQMSVPSADGKGVKWEYQLGKDGNLSVNGNPVGQVLPPLPAAP